MVGKVRFGRPAWRTTCAGSHVCLRARFPPARSLRAALTVLLAVLLADSRLTSAQAPSAVVTEVATAQALDDAIRGGDRHVHVTAHLDLRAVLTRVDGVEANGPTLFAPVAALKSLTVRATLRQRVSTLPYRALVSFCCAVLFCSNKTDGKDERSPLPSAGRYDAGCPACLLPDAICSKLSATLRVLSQGFCAASASTAAMPGGASRMQHLRPPQCALAVSRSLLVWWQGRETAADFWMHGLYVYAPGGLRDYTGTFTGGYTSFILWNPASASRLWLTEVTIDGAQSKAIGLNLHQSAFASGALAACCACGGSVLLMLRKCA